MKKPRLFQKSFTTALIFVWGFSLSAVAAGSVDEKQNTFVGNGGNAGDLELQMTIEQILKTTKSLIESPASENAELCKSAPLYEGRALGQYLDGLTEPQRAACAKILRDKASSIAKWLSPEGGLLIDWVDHSMTVKEKAGVRQADAVANIEGRRITLNREKFLAQLPGERVFLLTHELFHMVKIDGRYIRDDEPVGPFQRADGGRHLLNALGGGLAMKAFSDDVYETYAVSADMSKNYAKNWLIVTLGIRSGDDEKSAFGIDSYSGGDLQYARQITSALSVFGKIRSFTGEDDFLTETHGKATESAAAIGVAWRLMPFRDPLTKLGQSFFNLGVGVESMRADYELKDNSVTLKDDAKSTSALVQVQYFYPLMNGFWILGQFAGTAHHYEFEDLNVKSQSGQFFTSIGASYAF